MSSQSVRRTIFLAALTLATGAAAASAQLARAIDAGDGLYLTTLMGQTVVREPSGEVSALPLPPSSSIRGLQRLQEGWLATGSVEVRGGADLLLVESRNGRRFAVPPPANPPGHRMRDWPVALVERGHLVGVAWVAGSEVRDAAVYAALWSGFDFSEPELVSASGPGSQMALTGATLVDGSWLLVWNAWDGEDSEILWSLRKGGVWSPPATVHAANAEHDVAPALIATGTGALAAWSWFDGNDYRLKLARFERGAWTPVDFLGEPGSSQPGFLTTATGALLLYHTPVPRRWVLLELDELGTPLGRSPIDDPGVRRPALVPGEDGLEAEWSEPGASRPVRRGGLAWRREP